MKEGKRKDRKVYSREKRSEQKGTREKGRESGRKQHLQYFKRYKKKVKHIQNQNDSKQIEKQNHQFYEIMHFAIKSVKGSEKNCHRKAF